MRQWGPSLIKETDQHCKCCGAIVTSDFCEYCGMPTRFFKSVSENVEGNSVDGNTAFDPVQGVYTAPDMIDDISRNDFQYPVIECIEAKLSISLLITYLLFGITFGGIGSWMFFSMIGGLKGAGFFTGGWLGALFCLPFIAVGVFMSGKVIASIVRIVRVKLSGEQLIATVYDYFDDSSLRINGRPAQTVKLVADLPQGTRFLMYQLGNVSQPYPIGSQVELLYKDKLYYLKGEYFG